MRTINLKKRAGFEDDLDLLITVMNQPPQGGFNLSSMKSSLEISDKLKDVEGDDLLLEDAEWKYLRDRFDNFKWGVASHYIVELADKVKNAKKHVAST